MKSYASAVSKSCSERLHQSGYRLLSGRLLLRKNDIVYGVSETEGEDVRSKVEHVLADIGEKPVVRDCSRLGSRK